MAHELLAKATRCPELAFDKEESEMLAKSAMNVMRHYSVKPQQKAVDWFNLLSALTIVYGARYSKIQSRHAAERNAKREAEQGTMEPFNIPPPNVTRQ